MIPTLRRFNRAEHENDYSPRRGAVYHHDVFALEMEDESGIIVNPSTGKVEKFRSYLDAKLELIKRIQKEDTCTES